MKLNISSLFTKHPIEDEDFSGVVDLPSKPPAILYHVTHKKNLEDIKKRGLTPRVGDITQSAHGSNLLIISQKIQ